MTVELFYYEPTYMYRMSSGEGGFILKRMGVTFLLAGGTIFLAFCMIAFPEETFNASIRGLNLWWEVVFPSLLPFFIIAELLIGFGVVKFIGVLFEPIMRPIFNVPGVGSFALSMGMASGYPAGAKISARLRGEKQLSKMEAERLVSFTNASSPLFIFAAVSVGFFNDARLGILLAVCHYGGNILVGMLMRFHGQKKESEPTEKKHKHASIGQAWKEMHESRINDKRPIGVILGDAVTHSVQTLLMIGGFIIFFSVLTKLITVIGIATIFAHAIALVFQPFGVPAEFALPFFSGLFEISLGAQSISDEHTNVLLSQIAIVSFTMGFNGFSVHAQVASIIAKTDIRFIVYFISRLLHGSVACLLTILLFKPLYLSRKAQDTGGLPVFQSSGDPVSSDLLYMIQQIGPIFTIGCLALTAFIFLMRKSEPTKKGR